MYKIDKRPSGYVLTFAGNIDSKEMDNWHKDSQKILETEERSGFGVIINMKDLLPLSNDTTGIMISGQKLYKDKGMLRSAVILNNGELTSQFKNLAIQSGIFVTERYIDASVNANPVDTAIGWVKDSLDPDKAAAVVV
jgi:hypothetical protein